MKKLFISISILFFLACSDSDLSGYTESIIKGSNTPNLQSLSKKEESQSLKKTVFPLEEELSSLDEEELKEKLMSTYPWPKAEGTPEPESQTKSNCYLKIQCNGDFELPFNPYSGKIEPFEWKNVAPAFTEPEKYPYGFDRDPEGKDSIVYISTKIEENSQLNESAFTQNEGDNQTQEIPIVKIYIPGNYSGYSKYYLLHKNYIMDKNVASVIRQHGIEFYDETTKKNSSGKIEYTIYNKLKDENGNTYALEGGTKKLDGGTYYLYGLLKNKKEAKSNSIKKYKNIGIQIQVIPYSSVTKNFVYIQIDGNEGNDEPAWDVENDKNSFTEERVINGFEEIYKQAVVFPQITNISPIDFGINKLIKVDMTLPDDNTYKAMYYKALQKAKNQTNSNALSNSESPYWHIVYAINKIRKEWRLAKCENEDFDLSLCENTAFNPENEDINTTYHIYNGCGGNVKESEDVIIKVAQNTIDKTMHYYIYDKNGQKIKYKDCDILYTDNGYPVVPSISGVNGTAGVSVKMAGQYNIDEEISDYSGQTTKFKFNFNLDKFEHYLPYGSIIFVPRGKGESARHVLMHELGHSFGLTDVSLSDIYKITEKSKYKNEQDIDNHGLYINKKGNIGEREYENYYASSETNLMSWHTPEGKRIRYRNVPIACTGGTKYYASTEKNKYILLGAIERLIQNGYENQWECVRGKCYDSKYSTNFSTDERKEFWNPSERCFVGNFTLDHESAKNEYAEDKEVFDEILDKSMENKILKTFAR